MTHAVIQNAEERMKKAIEALKRELSSLRAGRATPSLLDKIQVDYYGTPTPLNQVGTISTPDPRTLVIQPWDKSVLDAVEKAIQKSDLGLTPNNDGNIIRINIPPLTEERRTELVKMTRKYGEDAKVAVRNVRRDANDEIRKLEKGELSEDESRRLQDEIQKLTDRYVKEVDQVLAAKEKEIMEV
jgi:ribosome recycling factor